MYIATGEWDQGSPRQIGKVDLHGDESAVNSARQPFEV